MRHVHVYQWAPRRPGWAWVRVHTRVGMGYRNHFWKRSPARVVVGYLAWLGMIGWLVALLTEGVR